MKKTAIIAVILIICLTGCKTTKSENTTFHTYNDRNTGNKVTIDLLSGQDKTDKSGDNKNYKNTDVVYDKKLDIPYTINSYAVNCYYITEAAMYIGTDDGLFISGDRGKTWKLFDQSLADYSIKAIFVDEFETVYLGTFSGLLVYSTKEKQWIMKKSLPVISSIHVHGNTIILGSGDNSIYVSHDNGKTWDKKQLFPSNHVMFSGAFVRNIVCDGSKIFLLSDQSNIGLSSDNGKTWKTINPNIYINDIKSIAIFQNKLYLAGGDGNLYNSEDDGVTWKKVIIGKDDIPVYLIAATGSHIYIVTNHGIYRQTSGGWQFAGPDNPTDFTPRTSSTGGSFFVYKNVMMVNTKQYRILVSEDYGKTWENNIASGISCLYAKENLIMCGTQFGLNISRDKGKTWKRVSTLNVLANDDIASIDYNGESIVIGTRFSKSGGGVLRSDDYGATWQHHYLKQYEISRVMCHGDKIFAGSKIAPENFHVIDLKTNEVESFELRDWVKDFIIFKNNIYLCSWSGTYPLYVSKDNGRNWTGFLREISGSRTLSCIAFLNGIMIAGTAKNGILFLNSDHEIIREIKNLPGNAITCLMTRDNTIFAGTSGGLAVSNDAGETWNTFGELNTPIMGMSIDSGALYVATAYECHVLDIVHH